MKSRAFYLFPDKTIPVLQLLLNQSAHSSNQTQEHIAEKNWRLLLFEYLSIDY
jgi:hypothetical protein